MTDRTIRIRRDDRTWYVSLPMGPAPKEWIALPYTAQMPAATIAEELRARFPGYQISHVTTAHQGDPYASDLVRDLRATDHVYGVDLD